MALSRWASSRKVSPLTSAAYTREDRPNGISNPAIERLIVQGCTFIILKGNKNAFTRGPLWTYVLGCSPSPRPESQNSNNTTVSREPQVDLISFGISTGQPHLRTTVSHYQQTDLLSIDSSPLLRFNEANDTPKEKDIFLNFHTDDRGTSFIYQSSQKTPLKQTIAWGLLFLFFVGLARLISNAEGVELWVLVLALGLGTLVLTRVRWSLIQKKGIEKFFGKG